MELKNEYSLIDTVKAVTFNRTAYGIEKTYRPTAQPSLFRTFNRTAYGIEKRVFQGFPAEHFSLLIAPLMELKSR